jgi:anaerobic ribonucleoside-triphosphate reductase activating protein
MTTDLRVHSFVPSTRANGPGNRAALWLQGCTLGCPGCFNPETHAGQGLWQVRSRDIVTWFRDLEPAIEGVTVSGGEPLQQWEGLVELLHGIAEETSLSVVLFSGFSFDEIGRMGRVPTLRETVDVLIAGRYVEQQRIAKNLRGSSNKTIHFFSTRYGPEDIQSVPVAEVLIDPAGGVTLTGVDPLHWSA